MDTQHLTPSRDGYADNYPLIHGIDGTSVRVVQQYTSPRNVWLDIVLPGAERTTHNLRLSEDDARKLAEQLLHHR